MPYPVTAPEERSFVPAPEGEHNAVCVDIIDLGYQEGFEGKSRHMCRLVFELQEKTEEGTPFTVNQRYGVSLHENSNLRKDLEKWRGKPFSEEELKYFDLDKLLGAPCRLFISHNTNKENKVFANIDSILRAKTAMKPSGTYVRRKDRDDWVPPKKSPWNKTDKLEPPPSFGPEEEAAIPSF